MKEFLPEEIIVERGSEGSLIYRNLRAALPQVPFRFVEANGQSPWGGILSEPAAGGRGTTRRGEDISAANGNGDFGAAKKKLLLTRHKGEFLKKCPGSDGQVCCNYFVVNFASNCPMDCSYCYLQEYLAQNPALKVFSNVDDLMAEADEFLAKHPRFFFRIGTGEITDSLALEPYIGFARAVVPFFARQPNVLLELKTKSDCVDGLLGLDPKERVVVSWSMNPQPVIDRDEHGTASLEERLRAARRCQGAGYRLGFHFDPMIEYPGWEDDYRRLVEEIFATLDWRRISWLSLGVLRQTPGLRRTMGERFPRTNLLTGEQVSCPDGKLRYFQPLRVAMYRKMLGWIRRAAPTVKIYLCMESKEVWEQVFGYAPSCEKDLGNELVNFGF
jgi:spore photoproduct lyase